jgi:hypothetical protein
MIKNVYWSSCRVFLFLSDFNELPRQIRKIYSYTKFYENPFIGSRIVACGQTNGWRELKVAFRNFLNASKNGVLKWGNMKVSLTTAVVKE